MTGVDARALLAAYDEQVRRHPEIEGGDPTVEREPGVVRVIDEGWRGVTWADLDEAGADAAIARQVERFAGLGDWEWKHYAHDRPADLPARLLRAGFVADEPETLMVAPAAQVADVARDVPAVEGVELRPVTDAEGVAALVRVHEQVFGADAGWIGRELLAQLATDPPGAAAVVAWAGDVPVCSGRVTFLRGAEFAGLWGGGTLPAWRGRGVFRALVAHRARLAVERGYRYLQVDASAESRPILRRLGFTELTTTTPYVRQNA
jgi:GNAT superfamily N-acetyltransferase